MPSADDLDRILVFDPTIQHGLIAYVREWFAAEDEILRTVRANIKAHHLPMINIRPEEGQMLGFLAAAIGARRILEIGTLAGYSAIWLARALPAGGQLITLEQNPDHARLAREHFALAGLSDRVTLIEGSAHDLLAESAGPLAGPFDMVFIDAEKSGYPAYLAWAADHVRSGGLITAHNAFSSGRLITEPHTDRMTAIRGMLETMARNDRLAGTIIPVGDGLAAALVR
ncbi:MAG: O-methyltransferase [Anaerolineae bacterium]|nr:O-methyltransferase [Anaerolineae bacterium]